jgi:leucine dehydrogenase
MGIKAAVRFRRGSDDLRGLTVAVQGLGSVGKRLARYLADAGARLVVANIDEALVRNAVRDYGATPATPGDIHRAKADVFAPCALGAILNDKTIPELGAAIVAGAANNQLAEARHGALLKARGVLYAPDYVVNAGGLIDIHVGEAGGGEKAVLERTARIYDTALAVFERAAAEDAPTGAVADRMAEERFRGEKRRAAA